MTTEQNTTTVPAQSALTLTSMNVIAQIADSTLLEAQGQMAFTAELERLLNEASDLEGRGIELTRASLVSAEDAEVQPGTLAATPHFAVFTVHSQGKQGRQNFSLGLKIASEAGDLNNMYLSPRGMPDWLERDLSESRANMTHLRVILPVRICRSKNSEGRHAVFSPVFVDLATTIDGLPLMVRVPLDGAVVEFDDIADITPLDDAEGWFKDMVVGSFLATAWKEIKRSLIETRFIHDVDIMYVFSRPGLHIYRYVSKIPLTDSIMRDSGALFTAPIRYVIANDGFSAEVVSSAPRRAHGDGNASNQR